MCSIFGSKDKKEFFELAKLNGYRGTHSHSLAIIRDNSVASIDILSKGFGPLEEQELKEKGLFVGHQQAPTTKSTDSSAIHPSEGFGYLWHNGIIKDYQVKKWQKEYNLDVTWDTRLLHRHIESKQFDGLSEADGSFACLYYFLGSMWLFRNDNCPMFVKGSSFSSTKFEGSEPIKSGIVYKYRGNSWEETMHKFNTATEYFWSPT